MLNLCFLICICFVDLNVSSKWFSYFSNIGYTIWKVWIVFMISAFIGISRKVYFDIFAINDFWMIWIDFYKSVNHNLFQLQFITLWKNFATLREKFETLTPWLNIYLINLYLIKFAPSSLKGFLKFSNCDLISYISSIKTTFIVFIWAANAFSLSVFGNSINLLTNQGRFPWEISLVFRSSTRIINEDRAFPATFGCV